MDERDKMIAELVKFDGDYRSVHSNPVQRELEVIADFTLQQIDKRVTTLRTQHEREMQEGFIVTTALREQVRVAEGEVARLNRLLDLQNGLPTTPTNAETTEDA